MGNHTVHSMKETVKQCPVIKEKVPKVFVNGKNTMTVGDIDEFKSHGCGALHETVFSNPQIDRHIIRKFVSKIVPNGRNHFRWYMNLDGKDTTTIDMVTEGRKSNAVISFNDDEEDEPPLHIGDVIGLTELQQFFPNLLKNENQNGIISNVAKCGEKSSLDAILHRLRSAISANKKLTQTA